MTAHAPSWHDSTCRALNIMCSLTCSYSSKLWAAISAHWDGFNWFRRMLLIMINIAPSSCPKLILSACLTGSAYPWWPVCMWLTLQQFCANVKHADLGMVTILDGTVVIIHENRLLRGHFGWKNTLSQCGKQTYIRTDSSGEESNHIPHLRTHHT